MMVDKFQTPIQYLNWINNHGTSVGKDTEDKQQLEKNVIYNVVASVLIKAKRDCPKFERHFEINKSSLSIKHAVTDMMLEENYNEYRLRLFIKEPSVRGAFEMIAGHHRNIPENAAVVRLNQHLIIEERAALLRHMRQCMDREYLSPAKISHWLSPVMTSAFNQVHRKIIRGYGVRSFVMPTKESLTAVLTCKSKDSEHIFTTKLHIDFAVSISNLPENFKLRHPFPKSHPFQNKGREMFRDIKASFEQGDLQVCLTAQLTSKMPVPQWYTDGTLLQLTKRERRNKMISVNNFYLHSSKVSSPSTLAVITGKTPHEDILWTIDYDIIEKTIQFHVKTEPTFQVIQEALQIYHILATSGNKVVPMLNETIRRAIGLRLYKQIGDRRNNLFDTLKAVLIIVNKCVKDGFCPSFCQPTVNTIDTQISDLKEDGVSNGKETNLIAKSLQVFKDEKIRELIDFIGIQ